MRGIGGWMCRWRGGESNGTGGGEVMLLEEKLVNAEA